MRASERMMAAAVLACLGSAAAAKGDDPAAWMKLWNRPEAERGSVEVRRDEKTFASAPASMVVDCSAKATKASLARGLCVKAGRAVSVSVRMKMGEGLSSAALVVNLIGPGGGTHLISKLTKAGGWQSASKSLAVPGAMKMAFLHLSVEGRGKLWLDDLKVAGVGDPSADGKLNAFDMPVAYAYGSFSKAVSVADGVAHLSAPNSRGGAGFLCNADLTPLGDQCPVLHVRRGPKNRAARLRLAVQDVDKNGRTFDYDLTKASADGFTALLPVDGWPVCPAGDEPRTAFDPSRVSGHLLQGAWRGEPVDVFLREITFAAPGAELLARRKARAAREARKLARERERRRREAEARQRLLEKGAEHGEDGPQVQHVAAVARDILAVRIQERSRTPGGQVPYRPQPGDEVRVETQGKEMLAWSGGKVALVKSRSVWRADKDGGKPRKLGLLVDAGKTLTAESTIHGAKITAETLTDPRAYAVSSADDAAYAKRRQPRAVYRKSKPLERASNGQSPVRHVIYLRLPAALKDGARYTVHFHAVNTRQATAAYTHAPRTVRTDALHVTQIGYRPSDPLKRAYLSTWLGTGGRLRYDAERFELLDAETGRSVYEGKVRLAVAADQPETLRPRKNHNKTDVYHLDFSDFREPGVYRVHVPHVGVSYPFRIADDVWLRAFKASMHGLLCQRSGIELGPAFTDYRRPRPFHPADGMKVFRLDVTMLDGGAAAVRKALTRLLGDDLSPAGLKLHAGAWGGYMDAGDWDRRSVHLRVSYLQLELCELFGAFVEKTKLSLPPAEANNKIPDLLDEALWNLALYRRLQEPDGGVGGGVESTAHPRPGEASWQESLLVGAFAPDPVTSYRYAAVAAKAAGVLRRCDAKLAQTYRTTAERAWQWAEANGERVVEGVRKRGGKVRPAAAEFLAEHRALAAVELYRLTESSAYHAALGDCFAAAGKGDAGRQIDALFAYALLDDAAARPDWKRAAIDTLKAQGEQAIRMSKGNAFNIACRVPQLPMIGYVGYYSTPETCIGPVLPRLHYLTGEDKYLRAAVAAAQYGAGANPVNATMTTGLGHDYPRAPLHVDSLRLGRAAPRGITIYGPHDPTRAPGWVKTWILGPAMVPKADDWPAGEFHVDVSAWPEMSEYTVHQTIGPTGYYWGYLAARGAKNRN